MVTRLHATCIAIGGRGLLLTGAPGAGKSDLAIRLIDRGALLVSDDGVDLRATGGGHLEATAPATIAGKIELRGIGIVETMTAPAARIALVLALDRTADRMPETPLPTRKIEGIAVPELAFAPFEASAPLKAERALALFGLPA